MWLASLPARLIPFRLRRTILMFLFMSESRIGTPSDALVRLYDLTDDLERVVSERAMAMNGGEHPKHRLIGYHQFFVDRIAPGENVMDVGCGPGAVARTIARAHPGSQVVGVDYDPAKLALCRAGDNPANLSWVEADATQSVPEGDWQVIVLSNVLEHITDRIGFLQALQAKVDPDRILIRVPHFDRSWHLPLRREVGANYYSDPDHKIEPTEAEFRVELRQAGFEIPELMTVWGEIWAVTKAKR